MWEERLEEQMEGEVGGGEGGEKKDSWKRWKVKGKALQERLEGNGEGRGGDSGGGGVVVVVHRKLITVGCFAGSAATGDTPGVAFIARL